ncbi:hypothetical protein V8D89_000407 [Ganoderma adspersum]
MDANAIVVRYTKFYIPSDDVVLATKFAPQADESGPPRYQVFRVHKLLLGLRSSVFSNLFADANAAASKELSYDGAPLIELHGDNAEDIALLLNYLYYPESSLAFRHHDPNTPIAVSGVVRLSDKYLLEALRKRLVSQVVRDWPTTLREWDIHQAEIKATAEACLNFRVGDDPPVSSITFAQEFGCPEILPAAFYRLLQIDFNDDWSLRAPDSESEAGGPTAHSAHRYGSRALARWGLLDRDNLARYVHGLHAAETYVPDTRKFVYQECVPRVWEGEPDSPCFEYVSDMFRVVRQRKGIRGGRDPLLWLGDCLHDYVGCPELEKRYPKGLCEDCCSAVASEVPRERQRVWRELLPKWFLLE